MHNTTTKEYQDYDNQYNKNSIAKNRNSSSKNKNKKK